MSVMASEEASHWRGDMTLKERQRYMFEGMYASDVTFIVGPTKTEVHAHQFVIVCGSVVLESMLPRSNGPDKPSIVIEDVNLSAFREMLRYLYCEEADIGSENIMAVLDVAKRFAIKRLVRLCTEYLRDNINITSVCTILDQGVTYRENDVVDECLEFVSSQAEEVFLTDEFNSLSRESLSKILQCDNLGGLKEVEVYDACLRWSETNLSQNGKDLTDDNRRNVLREVLFQVRFSSMSMDEFVQIVARSKLLTHVERAEWFEFIGGGGQCDPPKGFNINKRLCKAKVVHLKRFDDSGTCGWKCNGYFDAICVKVDRKVEILGIGLFGGESGSLHDVSVRLIDDAGVIQADTGTVTMESNGSVGPHNVTFPSGVVMEANHYYTVSVKLIGSLTYYGREGDFVRKSAGVQFIFKDSEIDEQGTSVSLGQISEIIFKLISPKT